MNTKVQTLTNHKRNRGKREQYSIAVSSTDNINKFQKYFGFSKNSTHKSGMPKQKMLDTFSYYYKPKPQSRYF